MSEKIKEPNITYTTQEWIDPSTYRTLGQYVNVEQALDALIRLRRARPKLVFIVTRTTEEVLDI